MVYICVCLLALELSYMLQIAIMLQFIMYIVQMSIDSFSGLLSEAAIVCRWEWWAVGKA